jgi:hypothetical protein
MKVYVIVYKDSVYGGKDHIEGVIQNENQFSDWLKQHNDDRRSDDEDFCEETEDDFEIVSVPFFSDTHFIK